MPGMTMSSCGFQLAGHFDSLVVGDGFVFGSKIRNMGGFLRRRRLLAGWLPAIN
jgi:hypothetical protein